MRRSSWRRERLLSALNSTLRSLLVSTLPARARSPGREHLSTSTSSWRTIRIMLMTVMPQTSHDYTERAIGGNTLSQMAAKR
eukprot:9119844-Prorocentrum_lima.AAC.1